MAKTKAGAKIATGLTEIRTRVTFFLPVGLAREHKAILAVTRYLSTQLHSDVPVTGWTRSGFPVATYFGSWWSDERKQWAGEPVVVFIIDYDTSLNDPKLERTLTELEKSIKETYRHYDTPQEIIWIVAQEVRRYV